MKSTVRTHFNTIADDYDYFKKKNKFYYDSLKSLISKKIPSRSEVFEVGCGTGDILNYLKPKSGFGMDLSDRMVLLASKKYKDKKNLRFSTKWPVRKFDYIFMSDVIEHLEDPGGTFNKVSMNMNKDSVFIITMANPIWEPILMLAENLKLKMPEGPHNRISYDEIVKILKKHGLVIFGHEFSLLMPIKIPILTTILNKYFEKFLKPFCFVEIIEAKKKS